MPSPSHLFGRLHDAIQKADRVLLVAHKKPDGDTLGSSSSVLNWLIREEKNVTAFCVDAPPAPFHYLDNVHRFTNDPSVFDQPYDVVIIFDSGDLRYCGVAEFCPRLPVGHLFVNIDHHPTNERFGALNIVLTEASSTSEIIHQFYETNGIHVDAAMATSLMTGLFTDTSSFTNAATNPRAVDAASKLLAAGARFNDITKSLLHDKTIDSLKMWGLVLSRLHYNEKYDVASTYLLQSDTTNISNDIIDGVANFLNATIGQADTMLFLRELPNGEVKGSMRSNTRNVNTFAKLLGGGGHAKASGFTIKGRIEETANGPRIIA